MAQEWWSNSEVVQPSGSARKPAPVAIDPLQPIFGGETPEQTAARRAKEAREARAGEIAESAEERAKRREKLDIESTTFDQIGKIRTEFLGNPEVRKFRDITNATRQIIGIAQGESTPMSNIAAVFAFMRAQDPNSAVREGEQATAQNAAGVPERIRNYYNQLLNGERLSPEQLADMANVAVTTYNTQKIGYDDLANTYRGLMSNLGANPDEQGITLAPVLQFGAEPEAAAAAGAASEPGAPRLQVAKGEAFSTEADFKRRQDSAEAWAATQGLPFEQALAKFNADMIARGYTAASPETISVLQWYEQNRPGDRGAVQWELPATGVREGGAPGRIAALGSGFLTGGTAGLAEEIVQQFDPVTAAKLEAAKQYGREEYPGTTLAGEVVGGLLSPLSKIGRGGTVAGEATRAGVYGGLVGAGEAAPDAGFVERIPGALAGATIGGVTGGAAQRYVTPAVTEFTERFVAPVVQRSMTPAVQQSIEATEGAGIPLITSDIMRPRTWFGKWTQETLEKIPVLGTGGVRAAQKEAREAAITKLYDDFQAGSPEIDDITKDFLKVRGEQIGSLTRQKTEVLNKVSGTPVDVTDTLAVIDSGIAKYGNLESYQPLINKLQSFRNDLLSGDMAKIELTRKAIGDALGDDTLKPVSTELKKIVGDIYPALRQDMGRHIQKFGEAGDFAKWRAANEQLSDFATDLETSTIRRVLTKGEATPEEARALLFSRNRSDVRKLFNSLSEDGKRNARGLIIQDMVEKAGGIENLSPARFTRELKNAGKKIGVAFDAADADRLTGLLRALQFTRRADQAGVTTPTGQSLIPLLAGGLGGASAYFIPGVTGTAGALLTTAIAGARIYESKAVKNILVALSRTAPGSKAEQNVLTSLARVLAQQAGQEGGEAGQAVAEEMAPPKVPLQ